jgi:imidazolonepropionase-like amidohydrolase
MIVKTRGDTVQDAVVVPSAALAATLSRSARKSGDKSPGSRGKMIAMLRADLIAAREYQAKLESADDDKKPSRDLKLETLGNVIAGDLPLMVTAHRARDIAGALRLAREFDIKLWLDGAAESYLLIDDIKSAGVPVIIHPTMIRSTREAENAGFETAGVLRANGIPVALQAGYESYVPKTRVVLFEAAIAAANGLGFDGALASITLDAARILGVEDRVGSLEVGKDADLALYDGDPFEYTSHCVATIIEGDVVHEGAR